MHGKRIGVFGGTFDPIHLGHLVAATEVASVMKLDQILFVPAARPWQKKSYSDAEDRFLMTELAAATHPRFATSRIELDRRGPTYTVDTIETLRDFFSSSTTREVEFLFIVGADAALNLETWHRLDRLSELTEMVVVPRPGFDIGALKTGPGLPRLTVVMCPEIGISATDIRDRARTGRPIDFLVPPAVARYIRDHALYVSDQEAAGV